ncbi:COX15/CtaA family protein [Tautonia rosea]|uniref:COX15/CtaA family protein n=1 Tax=Tautonia rosea TaxID=2728037 RepID=UPI0014760877|nr:COX15/CtaA family protein [Tautonia rosea]
MDASNPNDASRSPAPPTAPNPYRPGPHRVALLATAFTWPLLFVGGLVTTYRVGMAVPDWPTTFGINMFLYNFWTSSWGVYIEHAHRLLGSFAGIGCIILAFWFTGAAGWRTWRAAGVAVISAILLAGSLITLSGTESFLAVIIALGIAGSLLSLWYAAVERKGLPALGWLALTAVIIQGALGGYRVRLNSTDLAAVHGCTGQAFFALMVALCVITGRRWKSAAPKTPDSLHLRALTLGVALLVYTQIVFGALLRHRSLGLEVHSGLAVVVLLAVLGVSWMVITRRSVYPALVPSARAMIALVVVQLTLGIASWWVLRPFDGIPRSVTRGQAVVRTAHQANGALLLAASTVLALRASRQFQSVRASVSSQSPTAPASRDLEAAIR